MTNQHPITPPPELVRQWMNEAHDQPPGPDVRVLATKAAQWGADQELEACCAWLDRNNQWAKVDIDELRDARRPKPPSLKEQALEVLNITQKGYGLAQVDLDTIRKALKALPE